MNKGLSDRKRTVITFFLLTLTGCIIGWIYEMLFYRIDQGHFIRRGHGTGPWLPIYGFGALGLALLLFKKKLSPLVIFFVAVVGSGIIEFVTGYVLYHFFNGLRLWDYNTEIWNYGNIGGYVCLRSVLIFGVMGVLFSLFVIPAITGAVKKAPPKVIVPVTLILALLFFADVIYGYIIGPLRA